MTSRTLVGVAPGENNWSLGPPPPALPEADGPHCGSFVEVAPEENRGNRGPLPPPLPQEGSPVCLARQ